MASSGSRFFWTTLVMAWTNFVVFFRWKAFRPMQTPAPPAFTESRMIYRVSWSPAFSPPAIMTGTEQASTIFLKDAGSPG